MNFKSPISNSIQYEMVCIVTDKKGFINNGIVRR